MTYGKKFILKTSIIPVHRLKSSIDDDDGDDDDGVVDFTTIGDIVLALIRISVLITFSSSLLLSLLVVDGITDEPRIIK